MISATPRFSPTQSLCATSGKSRAYYLHAKQHLDPLKPPPGVRENVSIWSGNLRAFQARAAAFLFWGRSKSIVGPSVDSYARDTHSIASKSGFGKACIWKTGAPCHLAREGGGRPLKGPEAALLIQILYYRHSWVGANTRLCTRTYTQTGHL